MLFEDAPSSRPSPVRAAINGGLDANTCHSKRPVSSSSPRMAQGRACGSQSRKRKGRQNENDIHRDRSIKFVLNYARLGNHFALRYSLIRKGHLK
jgi:hypothetical protein